MIYKVRKGLESPVIIKGMQVRDFWILVPLALVAGGFMAFAFFALITGSLSLTVFLVQLIVTIAGLVILWQYFLWRGKIKKYRFSKEESTISNRDLLNYL